MSQIVATSGSSFLVPLDETVRLLTIAGFDVVHVADTTAAALDYGVRAKALAEQGLANRVNAHREAWTGFVRAGASMIISYGARHAREWLST